MPTETRDKNNPKKRALFGLILPNGSTLSLVLSISLSRSLSYHMFKAPEAPDPRDIANKIISTSKLNTNPGAIIIPTNDVNIERDITLGLRREK